MKDMLISYYCKDKIFVSRITGKDSYSKNVLGKTICIQIDGDSLKLNQVLHNVVFD